MITITLEKIKAHNPCGLSWEKLLASKGGDNANMPAVFEVTDILESNDLDDTLWVLRCLPEYDSLWRKYAVWCARQVQHSMTDQRSINALDVAWRHSDGMATDEELNAARDAAWAAADAAADAAARAAAWAAAWTAARAAAGAALAAARAAALAAAWAANAAWAATWTAARTAKLVQVLTAGVWVDDDSAGKGGDE
jgi:hypothetical protein